MIRIDEIHENTFFAWLKRNHFGMRSFHMHPIGASTPEAIYCQGTQLAWEHNYITFFDAEPINLERFRATFDKIRYDLAGDIHERRSTETLGYVVTSEHESENVAELCSIYGWRPLYYFFWGWAALDWYRGYDQTFLITPPEQRRIDHTFVAPNRIIGGARSHRVELLYHIFARNLHQNNHVSCPVQCPVEGTTMQTLARQLDPVLYPAAESVFSSITLPINMPGETGHPMHSCWLSLWQPVEASLFYLVSETTARGRRHQLTEKIFKPICQQIPFILHATAGSLAYLRSYGFRTFGDLWDESYDAEPDDHRRIAKIADLVTHLNSLSCSEQQSLYEQAIPVLRHNYEHFYSGAFQAVLWQELKHMLSQIEPDRPAELDETAPVIEPWSSGEAAAAA